MLIMSMPLSGETGTIGIARPPEVPGTSSVV
jgi:hypothetical protein